LWGDWKDSKSKVVREGAINSREKGPVAGEGRLHDKFREKARNGCHKLKRRAYRFLMSGIKESSS